MKNVGSISSAVNGVKKLGDALAGLDKIDTLDIDAKFTRIASAVGKLSGIKAGGITPDGKWSIEATRCIGCCGLAPVMTINEDVYGRIGPKEVAGILAKYN